MPSDSKTHQRPSLSHGGHIERQATRRAPMYFRSRDQHLLAISPAGLPGGKLHRPDGAAGSFASFQGGDFEGSKNLKALKKIRCGVNFPSGGIARICVGRHSGIDAHSDTWQQRAGADVPNG